MKSIQLTFDKRQPTGRSPALLHELAILTRLVVAITLGLATHAVANESMPRLSTAPVPTSINQTVQTQIYPQLDYFFEKLNAEKGLVEIDGVPAFKSNDKFLPGKIAIGLGHLLLNIPRDSAKFPIVVKGYRDIADLTVNMENNTWGIYYYLSILYKLKQANLLDQALSPETLVILRRELDWRKFVTQPDLKLINLPTNYYVVAFSIARLRMLLGWEDERGSDLLLEKTLGHYATYSGDFGFSDETDGHGRFDRYSILLIAEICQRFTETGMTVTPELKALLRKATVVALNLANTEGEGFNFGRSIGAYGDTAMLEILSISAYLDVLSAEEKEYAYAYSTRIVSRYMNFWYNPRMKSVDLWGQGRRTDAYRGKHRILGENFSLLHQIISANHLWNKIGFENRMPRQKLQPWLDKTQPSFSLTRFARAEYDRALAIFRDKKINFSLLMVNGGPEQHANSPYYPLPFSPGIIAGVADSGYQHPQLLPKLTLTDGTELIGTAFFKQIDNKRIGKQHIVTYVQDELTKLGAKQPSKDSRIRLETEYRFERGGVTRTDRYIPRAPVEMKNITLEFASFSETAISRGTAVRFSNGLVHQFNVKGLKTCTTEKTSGNVDYQSPSGPMRTRVFCESGKMTMKDPLTIQWEIRYHQPTESLP